MTFVVQLVAIVAAGGADRRSLLVFAGTRVIREDESGLVIKRFGAPLPSGRIIALDGEAGYQAQLLPPGWHFGCGAGDTRSSRCR